MKHFAIETSTVSWKQNGSDCRNYHNHIFTLWKPFWHKKRKREFPFPKYSKVVYLGSWIFHFVIEHVWIASRRNCTSLSLYWKKISILFFRQPWKLYSEDILAYIQSFPARSTKNQLIQGHRQVQGTRLNLLAWPFWFLQHVIQISDASWEISRKICSVGAINDKKP